jgi:DNA processing protein
MAEDSIKEMAFLACLNDVQSLKKLEYAQYFHDKTFLHDLFIDIFERAPNQKKVYADIIKPIIEKSEDIREKKLLEFYIDVIKEYQRNGVRILPYFDTDYPKKLTKISDPPLILYQKGKKESLSKPAVAVVGTRDISPGGVERVQEIVKTCVRLGYVIVSGLALGSDTYAHKTTIACGGETIAVLPRDLDHIIPTENQDLAENITRSGSLVSEVTHLAKMHKGRYIERNRITSALSDSVIVIETGESGGSIRQAETAFKHGKPVYSIRADQSNTRAVAGHKKLVSMGAIAIEFPEDLVIYIGKSHKSESGITTLADFS